MRQQLLRGFYLSEYLIDPVKARVRGPVSTHKLTPQAVEVLLLLAGSPPSLVTREALMASVFGDGGDDDALRSAITEIRESLDDDADEPRFVETVQKRGYRLLVEPRLAPESDPAEPSAEQAGPPALLSLIDQLHRRRVLETGLAYLVIGWLLIQVADATFDQLPLPPWAQSFVTYLVIAGFPIALLLSWFLELTSRGAVLDRDPSARPERSPFGTTYASVVGALALASILVYMYGRFVGLPTETNEAPAAAAIPPASVPVDANAIAVLPFYAIDGSERTRVFSEGLVEDVINRLAAVPGLKVSARGDSFTLESNSSSQDVRRRLRVSYYVEGSVRITNDTVRVVAQLIDSDSGFHIVSRSFDRTFADFFEIQDEITNLIVANLRVALPEATRPAVDAYSRNASFDAYLQYRRGMAILDQPMSNESVEKALAEFEKSLAVDPDYAAAHAGICLTYTRAYDDSKDPAYIDEAEQACASALALNPNLIVVHNALGHLYDRTGRYADAERAFQRTLALDKDDTEALTGLADVYLGQQRLDEAEQKYRQAIGLQPGDWRSYNALGRFLYLSGRYREAAGAYREVVQVDSRNIDGWTNLATALMLSGDFAGAETAFERAIELEPNSTAYSNLGLLHYYLGETEEATAALVKATEMAPSDFQIWSNLGDALESSGDRASADRAFVTAERLARNQLNINPQDTETIVSLAWITAMLGNVDEAKREIARAKEIAPSDPYADYIEALVLVRTGDREAALDRLESAVELGYSRALIAAEPHLKTLSGEPRFADLLNR